jgi:hypothetical protein
LASFKNVKNAINEVRRIKKSGNRAFYRYESVKGKGNYYRVYAGTFSNGDTARNVGLALKEKGLVTYFDPVRLDIPDKHPESKKNGKSFVPAEKDKRTLKLSEKGKQAETENRHKNIDPPKIRKLGIDKPVSHQTDKWKIDTDPSLPIASFQSDPIKSTISIYGGMKKIKDDSADVNILTVGPKFSFDLQDQLSVYCKAGAVYGNVDEDDSSSNFKNINGWESALGFEMSKSKVRFGLGFLYRDVVFDHKSQNKTILSQNQTSVDYSGYSIIGSLSFPL